jgi:hypothetical protein
MVMARRLRPQACRASIRALMKTLRADADVMTSAWMAAGMTSRARRPLPPILAG